MFACHQSIRRSLMKCFVHAAGLAAAMNGAVALAVDCKLSVQASPPVLTSGQTANVDVFAHFPSPPALNAPYAFASASFDVLASHPAWSLASAGAIVGTT